jgi:hypothetical protein
LQAATRSAIARQGPCVLLGSAVTDATTFFRNVDAPAPAAGSSSLRTFDSRACRGCPTGWPRSLRSIVRLRQPLPGWPFTRLKASQTSRLRIRNAFASSMGSAKAEQRSPLAPAPRASTLLRAAPSCPAYRYSRPRDWRRLWLVPSRRPSKASDVTQCRFSRSIPKPGRASRRLDAGCRPGRIRRPPS